MRLFIRGNLIWLVAYLLLMGSVVFLCFRERGKALVNYGTSQAQEEWDVWVDETKKLASGEGPVFRREAESKEPPSLRLMRDYFGSVLFMTLLLSSALFFTTMVLLRGAFSTPNDQFPGTN